MMTTNSTGDICTFVTVNVNFLRGRIVETSKIRTSPLLAGCSVQNGGGGGGGGGGGINGRQEICSSMWLIKGLLLVHRYIILCSSAVA